MYLRCATAPFALVAPPDTFTITSGTRRTVRAISAICAGVSRSRRPDPRRPKLRRSRKKSRSALPGMVAQPALEVRREECVHVIAKRFADLEDHEARAAGVGLRF